MTAAFFRLARVGFVLAAAAIVLGASSCTTPPVAEGSKLPRKECYWKGDGVTGSPKIVISLGEQCVRFYKGDQLVGVSPISSGREGHSTRPGTYRITEKDRNHRSSCYGAFCDASGHIVVSDVDARKDSPPPGTRFVGAEMPCFMRITGGVGMHEGYLPGYPASHGCIRLPGHMAEIFFRETPGGTPVQIIGDASEAERYDPRPLVAAAEKKNDQSTAGPKAKTQARPGGGIFAISKKKPGKTSHLRGVTLYLE